MITGALTQQGVVTGELSDNHITGALTAPSTIEAGLSAPQDMSGELSGTGEMTGVLQIAPTPGIAVYDGATAVDPDFDGITLGTAHKLVQTDITVNPIQVESVSNPYGGRTVYIGGII